MKHADFLNNLNPFLADFATSTIEPPEVVAHYREVLRDLAAYMACGTVSAKLLTELRYMAETVDEPSAYDMLSFFIEEYLSQN